MCYKEQVTNHWRNQTRWWWWWWRRSFFSPVCRLASDNRTKEKGVRQINESTLVGRGTCFLRCLSWMCVKPEIEIEQQQKSEHNPISSSSSFFHLLPCCWLFIYIYIILFFFSFFFSFLQNDWNKRRRMMSVAFRVEVILWMILYTSARSSFFFLSFFSFSW